MHEQLVAPHLAETGRKLEIQTDKVKYKIVPCTIAGCNTDLVVNVFYAPYKGKCAEHGDKKPTAIATGHLVMQSSEGAVPNGALAKLLCPLCQNPLMIVNITEDGGFITFRCTDGAGLSLKEVLRTLDSGKTFCNTSIQVRPNWGALEMTNIPPKWKELIEDLNIGARMEAYDKRHVEEMTP